MTGVTASRRAGAPTTIFVNRYFFPDHSATSQILSDLAFAMAADGRSVAVITSRQTYDDANGLLAAREHIDGVEVHRVWTTRFGRWHLGGRTIDYVTFYLGSAWMLWRLAHPGDVAVVKTDPPLLSVVMWPIAWLRRIKLINWLQDVFPEVAQALGVGRGRLAAVGYCALRRLRDQSLRKAACNVVLGRLMAARIAERGVPHRRIQIIPNWADGTLIRPVDHAENRLRQQWAETGEFVVGYSGNLGRAHEYHTLIDAMMRLEQARAMPSPIRIKWIFIGGGALFEEFKREVARCGLRSALFLPYQPRERLAESLSASDVHLVSLRPELEGLIVPSKFYGIAAAGRASIFVGDKDGEIAHSLREGDCGVTVAAGDGAELARQIHALAATPERVRDMGRNARRLLDEKFDKTISVTAWSKLIDDWMRD